MFGSNCCFLACIRISQKAGKVVRYCQLLKNFPQLVVIHTLKGFSVVNEADVFLAFSCIINDPTDVDLWFLCLFLIQLEHAEVLSSHTIKAWLEKF